MKYPIFLFFCIFILADSHPLCMDGSGPTKAKQNEMSFCTEIVDVSNPNGGCCSRDEELIEKAKNYDPFNLSPACVPYQRQVACARCHPYAVHILVDSSGIMSMSQQFCQEYLNACRQDLNLPGDFCAKHTTEGFYAYPIQENMAQEVTKLSRYYTQGSLDLPTQMVGMYPKPGSDKFWIVNQAGQIYEISTKYDATWKDMILDIGEKVINNGERGLLGFAFSPDFSSTGYFFVNYVSTGKNTVIARYNIEGDVNSTKNSERIILQYYQPYENHNGGTLLFTPGDMANPYGKSHFDLYITSGDGGGANDPNNNAQNLDSMLGKILRLRMAANSDAGYQTPNDNIRGLVWAYGMRNPWKCSFDKDSLNEPIMFCGDVGENSIEKIVKIKPGGNYGWKNFEGTKHNYGDWINYVKPEFQYCHTGYNGPECNNAPFSGESITGGFIYRGNRYNEYKGQYIFADYQQQKILRAYPNDQNVWIGEVIVENTGWKIGSLAEGSDGEIYILRYGEGGAVYTLPGKVDYGTEDHDTGNPLADEVDGIDIFNVDSEVPSNSCANGVINISGEVCCPHSCGGKCGGSGCDLLPAGSGSCCASEIIQTSRFCDSYQPPCIIRGRRSMEYVIEPLLK